MATVFIKRQESIKLTGASLIMGQYGVLADSRDVVIQSYNGGLVSLNTGDNYSREVKLERILAEGEKITIII